MDLYLFRLSLKEKEAPDLFSYLSPAERMNREAWLRFIFAREHHFRHYGTEFIFRPETQAAPPDPRLIFGWFGREKRTTERTPPDQGFQPTEHLGWQAIFTAIDPTEHADGQKIAIEQNHEIGRPRAILSSFLREINADAESPYFIQAFPIISEGTFWDFAEAHRNEIIRLSFDVAVPNMFDGASDFERELRELRKNENVSEVQTTLISDQTIKHQTTRIESIVNYVERGAGELGAVAADGAIYRSSSHERHFQIDIEHHTENIQRFWRDLRTWIDRIFL